MTRRFSRGPSNWRYNVIKRYKHRAQNFLEKAETLEQKAAWSEVIRWFDSILEWKYIRATGDLALPAKAIIEIEEMTQP